MRPLFTFICGALVPFALAGCGAEDGTMVDEAEETPEGEVAGDTVADTEGEVVDVGEGEDVGPAGAAAMQRVMYFSDHPLSTTTAIPASELPAEARAQLAG